jgi:MoxR-like ATPase
MCPKGNLLSGLPGCTTPLSMKQFFLRPLGVFGFDEAEILILASLISEDPVLLIGNSGTGKTFLLNSISEALGLNHRHYNASLVSFDDLVGFPYPDEATSSVRFLPTPATIWGAESVLIDELSRCKPEVQNKFFSIIHERKMQGIALDKLRYRWAAMNPFRSSADDEGYSGSEPLDQALADRFAFIIEVPDWPALSQPDQEAVINPSGESQLSLDWSGIRNFIEITRPAFEKLLKEPDGSVITYCRIVSSLLSGSGLRISPRRARLLARNIFSVMAVNASIGDKKTAPKNLMKLALRWSIPQRAWKETVPEHVIDAAHTEAMRILEQTSPTDQWISSFLLTASLIEKIRRLFTDNAPKETMSLGVIQLLNRESPTRAVIFSFATYPLLKESGILNEEATQLVAKTAIPVYKLCGTFQWRESQNSTGTIHPAWSDCVTVLNQIPKEMPLRMERARQVFLYLVTREIFIPDPELVETELERCMQAAGAAAKSVLHTKEARS